MERLKDLRIAKNLTHREIATFLGIERSTYTKYETDAIEPTIETVIRLAGFYGVTTDYLLGLSDEPNSINPPEPPEDFPKTRPELEAIIRDTVRRMISE